MSSVFKRKVKVEAGIRSPLIVEPPDDQGVKFHRQRRNDDESDEAKSLTMTEISRPGAETPSSARAPKIGLTSINTTAGYKYDLIIMFPNPDYEGNDAKPQAQDHVVMSHTELHERLNLLGFITYSYFAADNEEIIMKVGIPFDLLEKYAQQIEYRLQYQEKMLETYVDTSKFKIADKPGANECWDCWL